MFFPKPALRKVPEITALFWIIKLLTTAMGEATSDFLVNNYNHYLVVLVGAVALSIAFFIQFKTDRYSAWAYWLTVSMVAVFGTMVADGLHIQLHVPYAASTILFAVILAAVFMAWRRIEVTLSIHTITTRRRELFYWATILSTFALGTAAGDFTANTLGLGYFSAGLLFIGLIMIPTVVFYLTKKHAVLWFWTAYVLTRPLGASFADWVGKPSRISGLNYGDGHVAIVLVIIIVVFVAYLAISKVDIKKTGLVNQSKSFVQ